MKKLLMLLASIALCGCVEGVDTATTTTTTETTVTTATSADTTTPEMPSQSQAEVSGNLEVAYIDVGQGDSILITSPENKSVLIDAGEGEGKNGAVCDYLQSKGINELEYVVATHPHSDHINAMDEVLDSCAVKHFYMPNKEHTTRDFENMLDALENSQADVNVAKAGVTFNLGNNVQFEMVAPLRDSYEDMNNYSAVVKMTYGDTGFLFTGDAEELSEQDILESGANVDVDVLKCGHHGSSSSTSDAFLDRVSPEIAVVSCGKNNDYGHPHWETIANLSEKNIQLLRTDEMGTIILESDGKSVSVKGSEKLGVSEKTGDSRTNNNTGAAINSQLNGDIGAAPEVHETIIGNKNSKKYHRASCRTLPKESNRVYFDSVNEAVEQGYTPCGNCMK